MRGPVWRKAPLLLFRYPAVLAGVLSAGVVLGAAAASRQLFLASVGTAAFASEVESTTPSVAGLTVEGFGPLAPDRLAFRDRLLDEATDGLAGLDPTIRTILAEQPLEAFSPDDPSNDIQVRPVARTAFEGAVEVVEPADGVGWWMADTTASRLGVGAGDHVGLRVVGGEVTVRVAGVYRFLGRLPPSDFWASFNREIYGAPGADTFPPAFLLGSPEQVLDLLAPSASDAFLQWEFPVTAAGLTLPEAERLAGRIEAVRAALDDRGRQLGAPFSRHLSTLGLLAEEAGETRDGLRGAVEAIALAGLGVAMALFGAAGSFGVLQRRVEYAGLSTRGVGAVPLGLRAAVETVLPGLLGVGAGWILALVLVRVSGPADLLPREAVAASLRDAALALALALGLLTAVVAVTARSLVGGTRSRARRIVATVPWEVGVLAVAAVALVQIRSREVVDLGATEAPRVDLLIPLFPILFIAGLGGLAARFLRPALARFRATTPRAISSYLAGRRLGSVPRSAALLVTLSALALGMIAYAGVFVASAEATSLAKARTFVGGAASITVPGPALPEEVTSMTTTVARLPSAQLPGVAVGVMAVDPDTLPRSVDPSVIEAEAPLPELLDRLRTSVDGRVPVLVAGPGVAARSTMLVAGREVEVTVVARAETFPGMSGVAPLVVAAFGPLEEGLGTEVSALNPVYQVWTPGPPDRVLAALREARAIPGIVVTVASVRETPRFLALSWIFGFLQTLGLMVAVLALAALLLYLQARQRAREVSYTLARSMGLRTRSHQRSVVLELAAMLGAAFAVGAALAVVAAALVHTKADFLPNLPPASLLTLPPLLFAAVAAAVGVFSWLAAWGVQRAADRARASEVMRLAG